MGIPMTKHYTEADLLETYYTQPGESMPVMMHLASCPDCSARYDRLDRKLRETAACHTERPSTFWSRQRLLIMKKLSSQPKTTRTSWRVAAAAVLAFLLGGAVVYKSVEPAINEPTPVVVASHPANATAVEDDEDFQTPRDPWESEELQDFHNVVQWESWVAQSKTTKGATSL